MHTPRPADGATGGDDFFPRGTTPPDRLWAPTITRWAIAGRAGTIVERIVDSGDTSSETWRRPPLYGGVRIDVGRRLAVAVGGAVAVSLSVVSMIGWLLTGAAMFATGFVLFAVGVVLYAVMVSRMRSLDDFDAEEPTPPHEVWVR